MELTKQMIDVGTFRNLLVYDFESNKFSDRLLSLLKYNYLSRNNRKSSWTKEDYSILKTVFISPYGAATSCIWSNVKKYDVDIIITDKLGENGSLQKYFMNELKGSLASGDTELVVGVGHDDVILGSF